MTFFYDLNKKLSDLAAKQTLTEGTSHQAKTTMKHVDASNASPRVKAELKKASSDIKPGTAGYDDRARMLKAAGVKDTRGPRTDEGSVIDSDEAGFYVVDEDGNVVNGPFDSKQEAYERAAEMGRMYDVKYMGDVIPTSNLIQKIIQALSPDTKSDDVTDPMDLEHYLRKNPLGRVFGSLSPQEQARVTDEVANYFYEKNGSHFHYKDFDEADQGVGEGNAFSKAVVKAKANGIQPGEKIKVGGNTYPLKESPGGIEQILQQHAGDVAKFKQTDELSDALYNDLFDYYSDNGEMPYGTQKARDGDPYEWISDRLAQEIGTNEGVDRSAFAKLAPPRDKVTFADKIAGAKKEVDEMLGDVAAKAMKKAVREMEDGGDEEKLFDAIAALYGDDIWDNDAMQDLVNDLQQAGPTDRELDFIITKGRLPRRLANIEFTNNDNVQFGESWEDMQKYVRDRANSAKVGDVTHGHKHDIKHTATGRIVTRRTDPNTGHSVGADDDTPAAGEKRGKGRPKGTGKSIGAKGPSGNSKLIKREDAGEQGYYKLLMAKSKKGPNALSKQEKEKLTSYLHAKKMMGEDEHDIEDQGEYDREGNMAKGQLHTILRNAKELHNLLGDNDNLPEWVQSKLSKIEGMMKDVSEYMQSEREQDDGEETLDEKAVSKKQQKFMGMVHAAQKGEKPASKEVGKVAKTMKKSDAEDFASTKHKGLPEKKKAEKKTEKKEEVDETTTSGSVATAPASGKTKAGSMFGKGVYEGAIAESFKKKLGTVLTEGMSINMNVGEDGTKSLSVNATDEDAEQLAQLLKMAGLGGEESCSSCGQSPCGCDHVAEDLANSPSPEYSDTNTMVNTLSGGLNGRKSSGQTTIPVVNRDPRRGSVGPMAEATEDRLWAIYNRYSTK